jgi:uncharacterized protein (DUF58 family)
MSARALVELLLGRMARVSGRALRPTRSGRWILGLALAVGFAAMNTGNNLLFFGWGLVLSSIVVSGILSESTLRATSTTALPAGELRAGRPGALPVLLENDRRVPAFGVGVSFVFEDGDRTEARTGTTFELRLSPGMRRTASVPWTPRRRGPHRVSTLRIATAAPFGFFTKERIIDATHLPAGLRTLLVLPERVDTRALGRTLWARLGETPAGQAGSGDEFFSLRPWRDGDDPRRIAWRRVASTGRRVVREQEATRSREIVVALRTGPGASADDVEDAIATVGSLVEDLLADGHAVGVVVPGARVSPGQSHRQRLACLQCLAEWTPGASPSEATTSGAALIVVQVGAVDVDDADVVVAPIRRPMRVAPTTGSPA